MDDAFVAFDMDFTGGNYAFMVVLPKVAEGTSGADALKNVEAMLTADKMRQVRNQMDEIKVDLAMPKFKIEAGTVLGPILRELGMNLAFGGADFRGISGEKDLFISEVIHKAFIEVTEEGAEAAAATAVVMKTRMIHHEDEPMKISVDHPFFFSIVEKSSGTVFFVGHVTDL
jgi:serpin B